MRVFFYLLFGIFTEPVGKQKKEDPHQQRVQEAPGLLQVMPGA
jgi:hypothetical protein